MAGGRAVLRPGDRVCFDGAEHQVLGLVGAAVRLRDEAGAEQVVGPRAAVAGGPGRLRQTEALSANECFPAAPTR
jgi:hypothetical protein